MWANRPEMKQIPSPKVGSCIIYSGGITDSYGRLCGHIGVIEHLYDDGSIDVSMSSFGGYMWRLYRLNPSDSYHIPDSYGLSFVGFLCMMVYRQSMTMKHVSNRKEKKRQNKNCKSPWSLDPFSLLMIYFYLVTQKLKRYM